MPLPAAVPVGSAVAAQVAQLETSGRAVVVSVAAVAFVVPPAQRSLFESLPFLFFLAVFRSVFDCLDVGLDFRS